MAGCWARVLYQYEAAHQGELSLTEGDVVHIVDGEDNTDTHLTGELNGHTGLFPASVVEIIQLEKCK